MALNMVPSTILTMANSIVMLTVDIYLYYVNTTLSDKVIQPFVIAGPEYKRFSVLVSNHFFRPII